MQQAREDLSKGLISEEEFRDIMEECDFAEFEAEENEDLEIYEEYEDYEEWERRKESTTKIQVCLVVPVWSWHTKIWLW